MNEHIQEDLTRLRDELLPKAFDANGNTKDSTLAEVVLKINSCLHKGYPRRSTTDPINKPFQLDPKFVAKCDQLGRSRRQFQ
jgi:hypothetical protein